MTERELRALRTIADELRALRQEIHTIHEQQQPTATAQTNQPVRPPPIELRIDAVTEGRIREYYEAENREHNSRWRRLKPWVETGGVGVAFTLAILTLLTMCEIRKQTPAVIDSAGAAKSAANTAASQLEIGARPWVKIKHRMLSPLTFDVGGRQGGPMALMQLESTMENVGQTVALNVLSWQDVIPVDLDHSTRTAQKRQSEWCDANRHPQGTAGYLLFPHDPFIEGREVGPTMGTISEFTIHKTGLPKSRIDGTVAFVVIGCVCYRSSFEPVTNPTHQTRFMYWLGKPEGSGFFPNVVPRGIADQLRLISMPFNYTAD